jgi:uncharacterized protein YutE (UPF0331/DUF86 family)
MIAQSGMLASQVIFAFYGQSFNDFTYQLLLASFFTWSLGGIFFLYGMAMQYYAGAQFIVGRLTGTLKVFTQSEYHFRKKTFYHCLAIVILTSVCYGLAEMPYFRNFENPGSFEWFFVLTSIPCFLCDSLTSSWLIRSISVIRTAINENHLVQLRENSTAVKRQLIVYFVWVCLNMGMWALTLTLALNRDFGLTGNRIFYAGFCVKISGWCVLMFFMNWTLIKFSEPPSKAFERMEKKKLKEMAKQTDRQMSEADIDNFYELGQKEIARHDNGSFRIDEALFDMLIFDVAAETAARFGTRAPSRYYGADSELKRDNIISDQFADTLAQSYCVNRSDFYRESMLNASE